MLCLFLWYVLANFQCRCDFVRPSPSSADASSPETLRKLLRTCRMSPRGANYVSIASLFTSLVEEDKQYRGTWGKKRRKKYQTQQE